MGIGAKTVHEILKLLNVIFSSFTIDEKNQLEIFNYIKSLKNLKDDERIDIISKLSKVLKDELSFEIFQEPKLQTLLKQIIDKKNEKKLSENIEENFAFFLLTVPIEAFNLIELSEEIKEKIVLIDFPGLDSINNIFSSNFLSTLLTFSDGVL